MKCAPGIHQMQDQARQRLVWSPPGINRCQSGAHLASERCLKALFNNIFTLKKSDGPTCYQCL